ncbi:MAG: EAL domain-containing protein, partial [Gammaproteobacteria bacterium]|nr:EAL domain-containing protein [Gammaproteobacteria bacterium]
VDLLAVYLETGAGGITGIGNKPYLSAPQLLSSRPFMSLVGRLVGGASVAYGNATVYDAALRLAAVPIENPLGGRSGVLVLGQALGQKEVEHLRQLVGTDVMVYSGNVVFGSTLPEPGVALRHLVSTRDGRVTFPAGHETYIGRIYPILSGDGRGPVAQVLLAYSRDALWGPYLRLARNGVYFSLLILLVAALAGISISRAWLTRPIKALAQAARAIGAGDLAVKVGVTAGDEMGELARSFDRMLDQISESRLEIERSRQRFHDFAESSSDWLWETDRDGRFTYVSPGVSATLGYTPDELGGHTPAEVFTQDNVSEIMWLIGPNNESRRAFKEVELWVTALDGRRCCLRMNGLPISDAGHGTGFRGTARDITKDKQDEERLTMLANQDHLTGLANRRRFLNDLAHEIRRCERNKTGGALLLLDLDHFKLINDTAGHTAGDEVIVHVANLLRRLSREQDLVARLSGDEFAVAFPNMDPDLALAKAQTLLLQISQLKPIHGGKILNTSASIGVVTFPDQGTDAVELLAKADTAMYAAKYAGRNRAHLYSEADMARELMDSQLTWKDRIHQALEENLFELAFQPIVPALGGPVRHYEVLVRIRGKDGTLHGPGNFIPTAEQFGLINEVDRTIVRKAVRRLAALPPSDPPVSFSINLSGLSVGDPEMLVFIQHEIADARVDQRRISFEITESAACENLSRAMDFIARIRQLGCHVSLDDFGVGFSSFSYLKHLRVDMIKIDGSFIRNIHHNVEDQLFVKALVDVARGMGIRTTAEFVESAESLAMVRSLGTDYVQGYFVGRPTPSLVG